MAETKNLLLFRKWDLSDIEVVDPGLKTAISLRKQVLPYTFGRSALKRFNKADVNIVERLINKSMHFGKKYAKNTGRMTGKKTKLVNTVKTAFDIIALKTGQNPVQVLVKAIEFSLQLKILLELFMVVPHTMYQLMLHQSEELTWL